MGVGRPVSTAGEEQVASSDDLSVLCLATLLKRTLKKEFLEEMASLWRARNGLDPSAAVRKSEASPTIMLSSATSEDIPTHCDSPTIEPKDSFRLLHCLFPLSNTATNVVQIQSELRWPIG